ncbi:uncharacterized oxidoreductase ZK1290.5-like [Gadus chalcogrammus]|uniref:uncharacterized oxidoreductase ZK1290.5-like n=1 Tax=Gadus chalcogrammus TaxID=1042646 RepID=UPI0024C4D8B4|nr:uncharacterized oxidoreductase ZK1290.5-like [Gadus chalcogrammus]
MISKLAFNCPTVTLSNGKKMPILGIGTSPFGGYSDEAFVYALRECGIRHLDASKYSGIEEQLAVAIQESCVPRSELWITNKLWPLDYGYDSAMEACLASCTRMGIDYFDMYMLHWPDSMQPGRSNRELRAESWRALEELEKLGRCRSIGVSNFMIHHLQQLKEDCGAVPHANQVEYHVYQQPRQLVEYCREEGIVFQGYSPLAKGQALGDPTVLKLAEKYGRTPAQICIRWNIQNEVVTTPKSTKIERVRENCDVFGFQLEDADMEELTQLHDGRHVCWDPTNVE